MLYIVDGIRTSQKQITNKKFIVELSGSGPDDGHSSNTVLW
jgi:hypothetical protein